MRGTFDRWLARPSTVCLLRRVIQSENACAVRHGRHWQTKRRQSTASTIQEDEEDTKGKQATYEQSHTELRSIYSRQRVINAKRAMFMSLRSSAVLLPQDVEPSSSWAEVRYQADVDSDQKVGNLLVDTPEHVHNMALWAEILNNRQRLHGMKGVKAVWNGMRRRNVDLAVDGEAADILWRAFIHATISAPEKDFTSQPEERLTTAEVYEYAHDLMNRTGRRHAMFYKILIGHWLRIKPRIAFKWHEKLVESGLASSNSFIDVVDDLVSVAAPRNAFTWFFKPIYMLLDRRDLYNTLMSSALQHELTKPVQLKYHILLKSCGDLPRGPLSQDPRIVRLFERTHNDAERGKRAESDKVVKTYTGVNRQLMNSIVGEVHDIKPKEFSDEFCARMFATRAFSVSWVIKGLAMFGMDTLGPLAAIEMAARTGTPKDFQDALKHLETVGIKINNAVFCHLAVKVAEADNVDLWQALLESDQHPEAYDDRRTQSQLLALYFEQQKWIQVHLSLLAASLSGAHASMQAWNRVLQHYMLSHDYPATASTLQSMQSQDITLTSYTMDVLYLSILPRRDVSKRPQKGHGPRYFEPTSFVAKAYIYAAEQGKFARPHQWIEVLKRLGMNHRWEHFERVVTALLLHPTPSAEDDPWPEDDDLRTERLRTIFTSNMRKAIFIWGFRSASIRDQLCGPMYEPDETAASHDTTSIKRRSVERWAQGLPLLQRLRDSGFDFPIEDVQVVFVQRMWILFGPGYSTRAINHEARRNNRSSLAHYINHANEVWEGLVDWVAPELLETENDARILPAFFGDYYQASLKRHELADVKAWSEALSSGAEYVVEPKLTRQKEAAWMQSPLRVPYRPMQPSKPESPSAEAAPYQPMQLSKTEPPSAEAAPAEASELLDKVSFPRLRIKQTEDKG